MPTVIEDATAAERDWSQHGLTVRARWSQQPQRNDVRDALRDVPDDGILVCGTIATLNVVVDGLRRADALATPIAYLPSLPSGGNARLVAATLDLAERFALPTDVESALAAEPVALPLVRNDIGGVLLEECSFELPRQARFGAQTYHDDELIANGMIRGLTVRPTYGDELVLQASVVPASGRKRATTSLGRAVQTACDPVPMWVDGRDTGEVEGRTWYIDNREYWHLRGARPAPPAPAKSRGFLSRLRRG